MKTKWRVATGKSTAAARTVATFKWDHIAGGESGLSNDWFETRFVYIQSDTRTRNLTGSWDPLTQTYDTATMTQITPQPGSRKIYGLTLRTDYQNWLTHLDTSISTAPVHHSRIMPISPDRLSPREMGADGHHGKYWGSAVTSHPDYVPDALEDISRLR